MGVVDNYQIAGDRPVVVLEESGQTEDDRDDGDGQDAGVGSLDGAQSLSVQRATDGDVAVDGQQNGQPGVDHPQQVGAREQPTVQTAMCVSVVVADQLRHVAQRAQQEDDQQNQGVGDCQRLKTTAPCSCQRLRAYD